MRALTTRTLSDDGSGLAIVDLPSPTLDAGEVEIEVAVSTCTPADRMLCAGRYYFERPAPFVPGLMGVGTVTRHRAGLFGRYLLGRRVFFAPGYARDGAWATHAVADANTVVPLSSKISDDDAVGLGNALTAIGLVETARSAGAGAVVVNAAAGNVGGLIAARCRQIGLGFIGIVRSEHQAEALRAAGCTAVFIQGQPDFATALERTATDLHANVLVDSLGGGASVAMMSALPPGSTCLVIGHLSRQPLTIDALPLLLGRRLRLEAFGIAEWMEAQSFLGVLRAASQAQSLVQASERMAVAHRVGLEELIADYVPLGQGATAGRTLVYPQPGGQGAHSSM